jgi:hypothetical protein
MQATFEKNNGRGAVQQQLILSIRAMQKEIEGEREEKVQEEEAEEIMPPAPRPCHS